MIDKQPEACAVPLHELLVEVPRSQRLEIEFNEGYGTSYIPVGRYCHEAAAELRRLHEVNAELVEALRLIQPIQCDNLHHEKKHRHSYAESCPVKEWIDGVLAKAEGK